MTRLLLALASLVGVVTLTSQTSFVDLWTLSFPDSARNAVLVPTLCDTSTQRARELASAGMLSHPDQQGRRVAEQELAKGGEAGEWGEILGSGRDLESVFAGWLSSPTHRRLLAEAGWQRFGWGWAPLGTTKVFVVRFWRP
jgi:uncharacterized protein YkwD